MSVGGGGLHLSITIMASLTLLQRLSLPTLPMRGTETHSYSVAG
jgi:hypothetical protein